MKGTDKELDISTKPQTNFLTAVKEADWRGELEKIASNFHLKVLWVAVFLDPFFAITDYYNLPSDWQLVFAIRISVSIITLVLIFLYHRYRVPSRVCVAITFLLISLQNSFVFSVIGNEDLLGQNLNYMALFIGAALFVLWNPVYSISIVVLSALATAFFIFRNPSLDASKFFVKGGLLLVAVAAFMIILIRARHILTIKEVKSRLALQASKLALEAQAEQIRSINENLEVLVRQRTAELVKKNKALEDYAFINAHKLRSPLASILGLVTILNSIELDPADREILLHLKVSAEQLDTIVHSITEAIEGGTIDAANE